MLPINEEELLAKLALTFIEGIGVKTARQLIAHFGDARSVLNASPKALKGAGGMGEAKARACKSPDILKRAEHELAFITKENITVLFLTDEAYPYRLKECEDAPTLLYFKGSVPPRAAKMVAIIGTRKNTDYGQRVTEDLVAGLAGQDDLIIVSGLATGIDAIAHKCSLKGGIPTIGVVGHGLDRIYPAEHTGLAKEMLQSGGVLTEFASGTRPDRSNFPLRNRVVAGLTDITVIVESDEKGGGMITAYMAASYNREVAAVPGRIYDSKSGGPNKLIRMNIAHPIASAKDLLEVMNWTAGGKTKGVQQQLFQALSDTEQNLVNALKDKDAVHADDLLQHTGMSSGQIAATLLQLEMSGLVKTLPGKRYRLN